MFQGYKKKLVEKTFIFTVQSFNDFYF